MKKLRLIPIRSDKTSNDLSSQRDISFIYFPQRWLRMISQLKKRIEYNLSIPDSKIAIKMIMPCIRSELSYF